MAALNGTVSWGIVPRNYDNKNLATMSWDYRDNYLKSANDQLRYQVQWFYGSTAINEGVEANNSGDVVNVVFKVETSVDSIYWETIGAIKKSRDIANKKFNNGSPPLGHRFTVDISQLVSDQLSYSLCPINKGTWQSPFYGGMNGGLTMQDNVIGGGAAWGTPISQYNVSENGTFRKVRVSATFEILDADKQIITATNVLNYPPVITVINSVNQFERDNVYYYSQFTLNEETSSSTKPKRFLTRCPNWYYNTTANKVAYNKSVRMDEEAEFLQWYVTNTFNGNDSQTDYYNLIELYGETFTADGTLENTFILADFNSLLKYLPSGQAAYERHQNRMLIQNVSPSFINANAFEPQIQSKPYTTPISPITSDTHRYSLYFRGFYNANDPEPNPWVAVRHSAVNWYEIDRENENIPYGYVRFHWLNSMGGIDSYTAKRDVVEGLTISRSVVERNSADRTWYQADSGASNNVELPVSAYPNGNNSYISDTMRGGDLYKGGREVSNVNADRVQSVYTEPLNKSVANWLEEMMLSPNVWIEKDTDATAKGNSSNPYLRPSTKGYIPVIITNSDIETVNQENGLVIFNIEYTLAHKVQTQRN